MTPKEGDKSEKDSISKEQSISENQDTEIFS